MRTRASLALDLHRDEFLALFGALPRLRLSRRLSGGRVTHRYTLSLRGAEILSVLNPVLGHDWRMSDAQDQQLKHYVRTVSLALDRHFPLDIKFTINNRVFNEEPAPGAAMVERPYARGCFTMSFCATSTSSRTVAAPASQSVVSV